jgi:hypothetical protein
MTADERWQSSRPLEEVTLDDSPTTTGPWYQQSSFLLFIVLSLFFLVSALEGATGPLAWLFNAFVILAVPLALRDVTGNRIAARVGLGLGLLLVVFSFAHRYLVPGDTRLWDQFAVLAYFLVPLVALIMNLARAKRVTAAEIFNASSLYVLFGICFGLAFVILHHFDANAFTLSESDLQNPSSALVHFSFTTLTTVGYGAISPVSKLARALSDIEAVLAQLYLAVILARLVSLQITDAGRDHK